MNGPISLARTVLPCARDVVSLTRKVIVEMKTANSTPEMTVARTKTVTFATKRVVSTSERVLSRTERVVSVATMVVVETETVVSAPENGRRRTKKVVSLETPVVSRAASVVVSLERVVSLGKIATVGIATDVVRAGVEAERPTCAIDLERISFRFLTACRLRGRDECPAITGRPRDQQPCCPSAEPSAKPSCSKQRGLRRPFAPGHVVSGLGGHLPRR